MHMALLLHLGGRGGKRMLKKGFGLIFLMLCVHVYRLVCIHMYVSMCIYGCMDRERPEILFKGLFSKSWFRVKFTLNHA